MANGRRTRATSGATEPKAPKPGAEGAAYAPSERTDQSIAKKLREDVNDPDEIRKALDDAAGMSRNLWLAFLSFGTFLVVTVGAVTHRELLRESPIKLPLLSVELPLFTFFWVAPLLVLIFHAYLLLNLKLMVDNVHRFNAMLKAGALKPEEEDNFRLLLTNFPFVQLLAGTSYSREGFLRRLLATIVWITVVLAPLVLLLLMQLQFLPYHSSFVTWVQRIVIVMDLALLWYFWPRIIDVPPRRRRIVDKPLHYVAIAGSVLIIIFAVFIATFPGEWNDKRIFIATAPWFPWPTKVESAANNQAASNVVWTWNSPYELLFLGAVNEVTGSRNSLWSNTLVVPDEDFVDDTELDTKDRIVPLRGRDLRGAVLVRTDLRKADFTGAILDEADLSGGRFDQAYFYCAKKGSGTLEDKTQGTGCTSLVNAKLDEASLRGAKLQYAHLESASLLGAKLQLANLTGARLQGTALDEAQLHLANLLNSDLRGASLKRAHLHGANVSGAHLEGASLDSAIIWHAKHDQTAIHACDLRSVILTRSTLNEEAQVINLEAEKVINAALKETSGSFAKYLAENLRSMLGADGECEKSEEGGKLGQWQLTGREQNVSEETCLKDLANFIGELGCHPEAAPHVARGLIVNNRVRGIGPFADKVEAKFLGPSCPGAADLTSAEKELLHEQVSDAADHK